MSSSSLLANRSWLNDRAPATRFAALFLTALLALAAVTLAARRVSGGLSQPLSGWGFVLVVAVALNAASLARRYALESRLGLTGLKARIVREFPTAMFLLLVAALWLPGTPRWAIEATLIALVADRVWEQFRLRRAAVTRPIELRTIERASTERNKQRRAPAGNWQQQLRRWQTAEQVDTLEVDLRVTFKPGQRHAAVHVAFCPPFEKLPEVTFEQTAGPSAQIKLGQLLPHGVRLDLKLNEPGAAIIELTLRAQAPAPRSQN